MGRGLLKDKAWPKKSIWIITDEELQNLALCENTGQIG